MLGFWDVLVAAGKAMASVTILYAVGITLAWRGFVDQTGLRVLGGLAHKLWVPAITFYSIAGGMSAEFLRANWGLALAGVSALLLGGLLGRLALPLAAPEESFRPWFVLACAFPNLVAIPLVFIEAICRGEAPDKGEAARCVESATTMLFTFALLFPVLLYGPGGSYALLFLEPAGAASPAASGVEPPPPPRPVVVGAAGKVIAAASAELADGDGSSSREQAAAPGERLAEVEGLRAARAMAALVAPCFAPLQRLLHGEEAFAAASRARGAAASSGKPSVEVAERPGKDEEKDAVTLESVELVVGKELSDGEQADAVAAEGCSPSKALQPAAIAAAGTAIAKSPASDAFGGWRRQLRLMVLENPPVIASILALTVASIAPLQGLLFGEDAPLQLVSNSLAILAKATPAIMNVIMACALGLQLMKLKRFTDIFGGPRAGISRRTMLALVVCKMMLVPGLLFIILVLIQDNLPESRWYRLLMFIEICSPTANNVVVLASILGQLDVAQKLALTSIMQFLVFVPAATLSTAAGLSLTAHLVP